MKKFLKFLEDNFCFLILVVPVFSIVALFLRRGYFGVSDDMHIAWLYEMDQLIRSFKFPPRYVPSLSYGFGYPLFNFVFPLPFYLGEIFHLLGFGLVDSVKIVFALSLFFSFLFMYLFLRKFSNRWLSLLGATTYLYAPYRATDVYVRGAIGESLSFVFLPLVMLSFVSLMMSNDKRSNFKWMGVGSLSVAALVLSHNITAYMFLPLSLLFPLFFSFFSCQFRRLWRVLAAFIGGVLVSSYFWVPAILDSKLMKYDTVFNYFDHFPTLKQLITPYFGYGASVAGPYDGMSFFIGWPQIFMFILGFVLFLFNRKKIEPLKFSLLAWSLFVFLLSIFMMNHRSSFVWNLVPFIAYFQFPWRFLTMVVFASSLLVVALEGIKIKNYFIFLSVLVFIFVSFGYFRPSEYLGRQDDYYINRYIPLPEASEEYKKTSEEYLRLPVITESRPNEVKSVLFGSGFMVDSYRQINSLDFSAQFTVLDEKGAAINIRRYNFPGWVVKLDGKLVKVETSKPFGQIAVFARDGKHSVEVYFQETLRNNILDLFSLFSLVISLIFVLRRK